MGTLSQEEEFIIDHLLTYDFVSPALWIKRSEPVKSERDFVSTFLGSFVIKPCILQANEVYIELILD